MNASPILYKFRFAAGKGDAHSKRTYICDFSRSGLNTRLYTLVSKPCSEATNIGSFIYCELSLAAEVKSEFMYWTDLREALEVCDFVLRNFDHRNFGLLFPKFLFYWAKWSV